MIWYSKAKGIFSSLIKWLKYVHQNEYEMQRNNHSTIWDDEFGVSYLSKQKRQEVQKVTTIRGKIWQAQKQRILHISVSSLSHVWIAHQNSPHPSFMVSFRRNPFLSLPSVKVSLPLHCSLGSSPTDAYIAKQLILESPNNWYLSRLTIGIDLSRQKIGINLSRWATDPKLN